MSRGQRIGSGVAGGAALGASLGSVVPGLGNVIGGVVGGVGGGLAAALSSDDEDAELKASREQQQRMFALQQQLQKDRFNQQTMQAIAQRMGVNRGFARAIDKKHFDRQQALDKESFDYGMRPRAQPDDYSWIGSLAATAGNIAGSFQGDPRAHRKAQLNQTADEAEWISAHDLPNRATALEENDLRTRSALFGSPFRMNRYEF